MMSVDKQRMVATITVETDDGEEIEILLPVKYEVCHRCSGKGTHVNPSVDGNGLTHEDFADDPDFRENYFSGMYDVACYDCQGARVVPEFDYARMTAEQKKHAKKHERDAAYEASERAAELRYGY